jgi:ATP-dependent Clp protease ATP-binding subunit ClpA
MFERFTERARQVVVFAQGEARALKHNYIGTEHLLLGLLREEDGLAARVLDSFDVTLEEARAMVARIVGEGEDVATGQIPFTPRAKKVLELSLREAIALGHNYIGTEHILLGVVRENEGVAARILLDFDVDAEKVHGAVMELLSGTEVGPATKKSDPADTGGALAPEVRLEIERVRARKEEAIDSGRFERAAILRNRERRMASAARRGDLRAFREESKIPPAADPRPDQVAGTERSAVTRFSLVVAAVGFPLGLLIGWLIWG